MAKRRSSSATFIQRSRQVPSEEKALHHNVTGRTLRKFFDVGKDEEPILLQRVTQIIDKRLKRL